jgi:hypothetical protein
LEYLGQQFVEIERSGELQADGLQEPESLYLLAEIDGWVQRRTNRMSHTLGRMYEREDH